jgi:hypothetical protein
VQMRHSQSTTNRGLLSHSRERRVSLEKLFVKAEWIDVLGLAYDSRQEGAEAIKFGFGSCAWHEGA